MLGLNVLETAGHSKQIMEFKMHKLSIKNQILQIKVKDGWEMSQYLNH